MEDARLGWMGYKSKLGGCLSNKNINPKRRIFFAHNKNRFIDEEAAALQRQYINFEIEFAHYS